MNEEFFMQLVGAFASGALVGAIGHWWASEPLSPYAKWLHRECWVRPISRPRWRKHVVTAVSWHGAICVKDATNPDAKAYWIKKQNVRYRVMWDEPECASEDDESEK